MNFSTKEKLAQMLLVGIPNKDSIKGVINLIKKYQIGGVVLYKKAYSSLSDLIELINKLKDANKGNNYPLTIAIDQEGGRVNRLPQEFENIKSAFRLGISGEKAVYQATDITSTILHNLGINMNFSPVLDIRSQKDDNAFIGNRAFSDDVVLITKYGKLSLDNHLKNGVIPVIKHFPGHGNINVDSHIFLPIIKNFNKNKEDLRPFKELMAKGAPAIMVGHILISNYTGIKPATLSKSFIDDFIRKELKYDGLIITDELGMRAIRFFYGKYRSMKMAFLAGNDLICCKYADGYIEKCLRLLERDARKINLDYHFNKIISYKRNNYFNDNIVKNDFDLNEINKKIKYINEL